MTIATHEIALDYAFQPFTQVGYWSSAITNSSLGDATLQSPSTIFFYLYRTGVEGMYHLEDKVRSGSSGVRNAC